MICVSIPSLALDFDFLHLLCLVRSLAVTVLVHKVTAEAATWAWIPEG